LVIGSANHLCLSLREEFLPSFFSFLQKGFMIRAKVGCSVRSLLHDQFGISEACIDDCIQTIFIDGKPVDDLDATAVQDGSTLALSSAMPGLLGAALRRGGRYAAMRSQITHEKSKKTGAVKNGQMMIKLFNLTLRDLGPLFLDRGIWVEAEDLRVFFCKRSDNFWEGCSYARVDGENVEPRRLPHLAWKGALIHLQLKAA
jgi:hypothetical protein